jgi:hypothetical protein
VIFAITVGAGFSKGMILSFLGDNNSLCRATTLKMKTSDRTRTTTGSTFNPGDSSVYNPDWHTTPLAAFPQDGSPCRPQDRLFIHCVTGNRAILNMVLVLPPAPAARVLLGRAFAIFSFWSAAARRRMAILAPPGAPGEDGRVICAPVPAAAGALRGEEGGGDDCDAARRCIVSKCEVNGNAMDP